MMAAVCAACPDLVMHIACNSGFTLDESITSVDRAMKETEINACGWINIKTSRVGGLPNAIPVQKRRNQHKLPIWIDGMLEAAVGRWFSIALATKGGISCPCDIFPSNRFFSENFHNQKSLILQNV